MAACAASSPAGRAAGGCAPRRAWLVALSAASVFARLPGMTGGTSILGAVAYGWPVLLESSPPAPTPPLRAWPEARPDAPGAPGALSGSCGAPGALSGSCGTTLSGAVSPGTCSGGGRIDTKEEPRTRACRSVPVLLPLAGAPPALVDAPPALPPPRMADARHASSTGGPSGRSCRLPRCSAGAPRNAWLSGGSGGSGVRRRWLSGGRCARLQRRQRHVLGVRKADARRAAARKERLGQQHRRLGIGCRGAVVVACGGRCRRRRRRARQLAAAELLHVREHNRRRAQLAHIARHELRLAAVERAALEQMQPALQRRRHELHHLWHATRAQQGWAERGGDKWASRGGGRKQTLTRRLHHADMRVPVRLGGMRRMGVPPPTAPTSMRRMGVPPPNGTNQHAEDGCAPPNGTNQHAEDGCAPPNSTNQHAEDGCAPPNSTNQHAEDECAIPPESSTNQPCTSMRATTTTKRGITGMAFHTETQERARMERASPKFPCWEGKQAGG
eukprot:365403-Chlamydomonas_euryale.AAC.3